MGCLQLIKKFVKRKSSTLDKEWNAYWKRVQDENCFKRCRPEQLKLDGYYTKLLKAYSQLFGLEHEVEWSKTTFGLGLEVSVSVKNKWYHSGLMVFKEGCVAYVSNMREYTQDANPDTVEEFSKKIIQGTFGEKRYIQSLHGGDCVMFVGNGQYEPVPRFEIHDLPRSEEELMIKLNLANIDVSKCRISLKRCHENS